MATKRLISTDLINQSWYVELPPKLKSLWIHLLLACDCVGSFEVSPRMLTAFIGEPITERDIFTAFGRKIVRWGDKGLITDFVRYQYYSNGTQRLSPNCKPHQYVLKRLAELGLTEEKLDELATMATQQELPLEDVPRTQPAEEKARRFVKPTEDEVRAYITEKGYAVDASKFWNYYEARGWKMGKTPMKSWKSAVATWQRNSGEFGAGDSTAFTDPNYQGRGGF